MYLECKIPFLDMRADASDNADLVGEMTFEQVGRRLTLSPGEDWAQVAIYFTFEEPLVGWVKLFAASGEANLLESPPPARPGFDLWAFLKACVDAEIWINAQSGEQSFFVTADYLIALADIESKISNARPKAPNLSDGVGPFQISSERWAAFLASPLAEHYDEHDREDGLEQIVGAAFLALQSMQEISRGIAASDTARGKTETSGETGPYIPAYTDILLAHFFGNQAALDFRIAKLSNEAGKSVATILQHHVADADALKALIDHRAIVLKDPKSGEIETIEGMLLNAAALLAKHFDRAYKLIAEHAPEDLPSTDGPATWFSVAEEERREWENTLIDETTPGGVQKVLSYFSAIGAPQPRVLPWCGAFAGFCMKQRGAPVVPQPARAANWKTWGNSRIPVGSPDVPKGAVVVLSPEKGTSRSGHVGFFSRYFGIDSEQVELLGGNQSDTVRLSKFARSKIVEIRWHSQQAIDEQQIDDGLDTSHAGPFGALLDLIGRIEAHGNYNAYFGHVKNRDNPRLTGMTVGQVVTWQRTLRSSASGKYQFIRKTLNGLCNENVVSRSDPFDQAHQDKLALALLKRRKIGNFMSGRIGDNQFMINLAREWASFPVPVRMRGAHRIVNPGQSYYAGDGVNKALVSVDVVRNVVRSLL